MGTNRRYINSDCKFDQEEEHKLILFEMLFKKNHFV